MNVFTSSAVRFRLIMSLALGILLMAIVAIAFFGLQLLSSRADEVSKVVYEADTSEQKLNGIRSMRTQMQAQPEAVKRAQQIVAESKSYSYQNVIVKDITSMADRAGVEITNYTFSEPGTDSAASGATAAPAANQPAVADPAAAAPSGTAGTATPAAQSSLKSISFDISLKTPVEYTRLLKFIHYIEQNATKMQISTLTLSKAESNRTVGIDALTIEVYVR